MDAPIVKVKVRKQGKNHKLLRSGRNKISGKYTRQRARTERNRKHRHQNHIRVHPNDLQAIRLLAK